MNCGTVSESVGTQRSFLRSYQQNEGSPDHVPSDDEQSAADLNPDLASVSVDCATRVGNTEGCAGFFVCEDAGHEAAERTSNHVGVCDSEGVVDVHLENLGPLGPDVHCEPRNGTREDTKDDGGPATDDSCTRGDSDETGDDTIDCTNDGGLSVNDLIDVSPVLAQDT